MRRVLVALCASAILPATALTATASEPEPIGVPTVLTPAPGSALPVGEATDVSVDFTGVTPGEYVVTLECEGGDEGYWSWTDTVVQDGSLTVRTWPALTPTVAGACTVVVQATTDYRWVAATTFAVSPVPLDLDVVGVRPARFNPTARDGYRDSTTVVFLVSRLAQVTATVRHRGQVVARRPLDVPAGGRFTWRWNGLDDDGQPVQPGRYRITLVGAVDGAVEQDAVRVRAVLAHR